MDVTVGREGLEAALRTARVGTTQKALIPVLGCALLSANGDGHCSVHATDGETFVDVGGTNCKIAVPGRLAVDAKRLHELVKRLSGDDVRLKAMDNGRCEIRAGRSRFLLPVTGDYETAIPVRPMHSAPRFTAVVPADSIAEVWRSVAFTVGAADRMAYNGVCIEPVAGGLAFVATNGHRLAVAELRVEGISPGAVSVVPGWVGQALCAVLEGIGEETETTISADERTLVVKGNGISFATRLLENHFPDWRGILPKDEPPATVKVDRDEFVATLRRAAVLAPDDQSAVVVEFGDETLSVSALGYDAGEGRDEVAAETEGTGRVALNAKQLAEVAASLPAGKVWLGFSEEKTPVTLRSAHEDAYRRFYVVAPFPLPPSHE